MNIYYINLNSALNRKKHMEKTYTNLTRIEAYDGNNLKQYTDIIIPLKSNSSTYELACSFSHIKAIITAYNNNENEVLIMEDDIRNDYKHKWSKSIEEIIKNKPTDSECIILHCINGKQINKMIEMKNDYSKWNIDRWSTGCYYINRKGMKKIYDIYFKNNIIDLKNKPNKTKGYCSDRDIIYNVINSYNYTKPLFNHQVSESSIHSDHLDIHKVSLIDIQNYFNVNTNISIIIPVYPPHFQYLNRCIKNIMSSTVLPNEIIIAASEITYDYEKTLYESLINICKNIKLIISGIKEQGYSGINRNRGAEVASSDILMFIDADDYTHPQKIEIIQKCFDKYPTCKQILHNGGLDKNSLSIYYDVNSLPIFKYSGDFSKKHIVNNGMNTIIRGHASVHRDVFKKVVYKNVIHREDNIFTKKVHLIFNESFFLPLSLMVYQETGIQARNNYYNGMNIIIYPSPNKELNVNEKMFSHPVIKDKFYLIEDTKVESLEKLYNDKNKSVKSITILLDNYGKFIKNNIQFIISHKEIKFYIHENDIHYLSSKPDTYKRYALLRDKLLDNNHIYILCYYWYYYSNLYKINKNNLICFPRFVFQKNIIQFNVNPQKKVLLSGSMSKYYPMRNYLKSLKHPNVDILTHSDNIFGDEYKLYLNKFICGFTCCLTKESPYIVNKFFEIPAAGCLLLAFDEYVKDGLKEIGFIDGENYISCNKENIIDKINYICNNSNINEVNRIRKNGQELIKKRHTLESRYDLLVNLI